MFGWFINISRRQQHPNSASCSCLKSLLVVGLLLLLCVDGISCRPKDANANNDPSTNETTKDDDLFLPQQDNVKPTVEAPAANHKGHTITDPKKNAHAHEGQTWLVYVSAIPTVLVFIICVIAIAIRNHFVDDDAPQEVTDGEPKKKKKKKKPKAKGNQEVYDTMLAKFKDEKNRKRSFVGRKSSQIRIEGMVSRSPKSLARKHIIIGQLNEEDLAPDGNSSALGQLVQLSTHTFIGSSLIEDMETPAWQKEASEQASKEFSGRLSTEPNENDALLPEDLEDVFSNFGNWEESLI